MFEYTAQLPDIWATAMYWSSSPSFLMVRGLACGIMLPLAPPHRPTVGLISLVGIQFTPCGTVTVLAIGALGGCGFGRGGNCPVPFPSQSTSIWTSVGAGACSTCE